jgi:hypothetical protein
MSLALFGFCMSRVCTFVLRLVWATRPNNVRIAIAAQIFTNAGVLIVYIVLLLLALRVFRATHPKIGWNRSLGKGFTVLYILLLGALLVTIGFTVTSFYTLNSTLRSVAMWIQRTAILYMMIFNVISLVLFSLSVVLPRASDSENFGTGTMSSKFIILGTAVFFGTFIAGFRTGVVWSAPRSVSSLPWYDTKAAFYVIIFVFEIIIIYLLLITRFDKRFWVPNGSKGPGDYSRIDPSISTERKVSEKEDI